jgi:hypothetical protein
MNPREKQAMFDAAVKAASQSMLEAACSPDKINPEGSLSGEVFPHEEPNHRISRVINREYVRKWALDYCATHEMVTKRKKIRCSESFLSMIEAATKSAIIHRIESQSPKGKTLT